LKNENLNKAQFEAAKGRLIYELINEVSTMEMAAESAILATFRNVGPNFTEFGEKY